MGVRGPLSTEVALLALLRTQGFDIRHRGSAIRRQSVTKGRDCGVLAGIGGGAVGCHSGEWIIAVTEQQDQTLWGGEEGLTQ